MDLGLAECGHRELTLAEHVMWASRPLNDLSNNGSLHMTIQPGVLIETWAEMGAKVRWCSCSIFSTQDRAAAAIAILCLY